MKIGYITKENPNDVGAYSGTHFSMLQALKKEFDEVAILGPLNHPYKNIAKLKGKLRTLGSNKIYKFQYDLELANKHARILEKRIKIEKPDLLLGSLVTPEVAYLKTEIPLYLTTDATFPLLQNVYSSHTNLHPTSVKNALLLEEKAFNKAQKLIFPLEWLSNSVAESYHISTNKIEVIPYGGNIEFPPADDISRLIEKRLQKDEVTLLFVGVRWEEKGGPKAIEITRELNEQGIKARLQIVGVTPKVDEDFVDVIGFLDKKDPQQFSKLMDLYKSASVFVLPTKAECVGMSFIEAASYALPAIGTTVGGVPEAIAHQQTGWTFTLDDVPSFIANQIAEVLSDRNLYEKMSKSAYQKHAKQMNWATWAQNFKKVVQSDLKS